MKQIKERKNSGFTLVELLIAITILGIIVGPFMHSFVTASRTNAKAQQIQNATLLATNLMEEVKSNTVGDLAFQFNYPKRDDNTSRFDVMNTYTSAYELTMKDGALQNVTKYLENGAANNRDYVTSSVLYKDYQTNLEDEYEFLGQSLGRYYFVMEGLKSGSTEYDALITLDSNGYKTVDDKGYNDQHTPVIESLDVLEDAFYVQDMNQDKECAEKLSEASGANDYLAVMNAMKRSITIDIEHDAELYRVYITYEYTYGAEREVVRHLIYNNSESPTYGLKSVYLFYLPHYPSTISNVKDNIVINNNDNVETNIYIIKQRSSSANAAELLTKETTYKCNVTVNENVASYNSSSHDAYVAIRTNLGTNLYNQTTAIDNQVTYGYKGSGGSVETNMFVKKMLDVNSLDGSKEKDRIYEVTVAIYKRGEAANKFAGTPVAKITGSKDN